MFPVFVVLLFGSSNLVVWSDFVKAISNLTPLGDQSSPLSTAAGLEKLTLECQEAPVLLVST